jgi:hypothetical protein
MSCRRSLLLPALAAAAIAALAVPASAGDALVLRIAPFAGVEQLNWNIADPSGTPDVLSELSWSDLVVAGIDAEAVLPLDERLQARARVRVGWIVLGDNRDSDYLFDGRNGEYSRSDNDGSGGLAWDALVALGYRLGRAGGLSATPLLGVAISQRRLRITDGHQSISEPPSAQPVGPIPGLDNSYVATWLGPSLGFELDYRISQKVAVSGAVDYRIAWYTASADWNLRPDFAHPESFDHRAWAQVVRPHAGADIRLAERAALSLRVEGLFAEAWPGVDRLFYAGGGVSTQRLNAVNWSGWGASAGVLLLLP